MYKTGDKIRINHDLEAGENYTFTVLKDMERYRGRVATIELAYKWNTSEYYRINIDRRRYGWTADMFTLVEEHEIDLQALLDLI